LMVMATGSLLADRGPASVRVSLGLLGRFPLGRKLPCCPTRPTSPIPPAPLGHDREGERLHPAWREGTIPAQVKTRLVREKATLLNVDDGRDALYGSVREFGGSRLLQRNASGAF
jgi:hypothetical protein